MSCGPVLQHPSRKSPVIGSVPHSCSGSPRTLSSGIAAQYRARTWVSPGTGYNNATRLGPVGHTLRGAPDDWRSAVRPARLVIAMFATACLLAGAGVLAVSGPASAAGSPSGVLISQLRTRSATSQFDEYVQITNTTNVAVDLSGWQLEDCFTSGGVQKLGTDGNPLPTGTMLPAGKTFVFGKDEGDYTGVSDATYNFQVTETGGFQLQNAAGQVQDSVGAPGTQCAEGTGLTFPTTGSDFVFTRKAAASGSGLQ